MSVTNTIKQINAGEYKHKITIYSTETITDEQGFQSEKTTVILTPHAKVKTTSGMTLGLLLEHECCILEHHRVH